MSKLQRSLDEIYRSALPTYYSGNNVDVFFDNIYVDECTMIGWRSVVNSAPAYAYNDSKFNSITQGNFRVEGKFAVNFVSTGYIEHIIQKGEASRNNKTYTPLGRISPIDKAKGLQTESKGGILNMGDRDYLNSALVDPRSTALSDAERESIRAKMRDYIWGHLKVRDEALIESLREVLIGKYFDILTLIGNPNTDKYDVKNIVDAQIMDMSIEMVKDMPLQLIYTFIARDVDRPSSRPAPFDFLQHDVPGISSLSLTPSEFLEYLVALTKIYTGTNVADQHVMARVSFESGEIHSPNIQKSIFAVDYQHINKSALNSILTIGLNYTKNPDNRFWFTAGDYNITIDQLHTPLSCTGISFGPKMKKNEFPLGVRFSEVAFAGLSLPTPTDANIFARVYHSTSDIDINGPGRVASRNIESAAGGIDFGKRFYEEMTTKIENAGRDDLKKVLDATKLYYPIPGFFPDSVENDPLILDQSEPLKATVEQCEEYDPKELLTDNKLYHPRSEEVEFLEEFGNIPVSKSNRVLSALSLCSHLSIEFDDVMSYDSLNASKRISVSHEIHDVLATINDPSDYEANPFNTMEIDPRNVRIQRAERDGTNEEAVIFKIDLNELEYNPVFWSKMGSRNQMQKNEMEDYSPFPALKLSDGTFRQQQQKTGFLFRSNNGGYMPVGNTDVEDNDTVVTNGTFVTDIGWTWGAGWARNLSTAEHTPGNAEPLTQIIAITPNTRYFVRYDIAQYGHGNPGGAGTVKINLGGKNGTVQNWSGVKYEIMTSGSGSDISFEPSSDFSGSITSVFIFRLEGYSDLVSDTPGIPEKGMITMWCKINMDFTHPSSKKSCLFSWRIDDPEISSPQSMYMGVNENGKPVMSIYNDSPAGYDNPGGIGENVDTTVTLVQERIYLFAIRWDKDGVDGTGDYFKAYYYDTTATDRKAIELTGCSESSSQAADFITRAAAESSAIFRPGFYIDPLGKVIRQSTGGLDNIKIYDHNDERILYVDTHYEGKIINQAQKDERTNNLAELGNIVDEMENAQTVKDPPIFEINNIKVEALTKSAQIGNDVSSLGAHSDIYIMGGENCLFISVYIPKTITTLIESTANNSLYEDGNSLYKTFTWAWDNTETTDKFPMFKIDVSRYASFMYNMCKHHQDKKLPVVTSQYTDITNDIMWYSGQAAGKVDTAVLDEIDWGIDISRGEAITIAYACLLRPNKHYFLATYEDSNSVLVVPVVENKPLIPDTRMTGDNLRNTATYINGIIIDPNTGEPATDTWQSVGNYIKPKESEFGFVVLEDAYNYDVGTTTMDTDPVTANLQLDTEIGEAPLIGTEANNQKIIDTIAWFISRGMMFKSDAAEFDYSGTLIKVDDKSLYSFITNLLYIYPHMTTMLYTNDSENLNGTLYSHMSPIDDEESQVDFVPHMLWNVTDDMYDRWYTEVDGTRRINATIHIRGCAIKSESDDWIDGSERPNVGIVNDIATNNANTKDRYSVLVVERMGNVLESHQKNNAPHILTSINDTDKLYCSERYKPISYVNVAEIQEMMLMGETLPNGVITIGDNCFPHIDMVKTEAGDYEGKYDFSRPIINRVDFKAGPIYGHIVKHQVSTTEDDAQYILDMTEMSKIYGGHLVAPFDDKPIYRYLLNDDLFTSGDTLHDVFPEANQVEADTSYKAIRLNISESLLLRWIMIGEDNQFTPEYTFQYLGAIISPDGVNHEYNFFTEEGTALKDTVNKYLNRVVTSVETIGDTTQGDIDFSDEKLDLMPPVYNTYIPITMIGRFDGETTQGRREYTNAYVVCAHNSTAKFSISDLPSVLFFSMIKGPRRELSKNTGTNLFLFIEDQNYEGETEIMKSADVVESLANVTMYDLYYYFVYKIDAGFIYNHMHSRFPAEIASLNSTKFQVVLALAQVMLNELTERLNEMQPFNEAFNKFKPAAFSGDPKERSVNVRASRIVKSQEGNNFLRQYLLNKDQRDGFTDKIFLSEKGKMATYLQAKDDLYVSMETQLDQNQKLHVWLIVKRKPSTKKTV